LAAENPGRIHVLDFPRNRRCTRREQKKQATKIQTKRDLVTARGLFNDTLPMRGSFLFA
jgi:hypothetical protein